MTDEKREILFWNAWRDILLGEFEGRLGAMSGKGFRIVPARKIFTAIFLQVKGFPVPASEVLPEAIRATTEKDNFDKEYDAIAMMGHRVGMVGNSVELKQYLQDVQVVLKQEGQILLTALDVPNANEPEHSSSPIVNCKQFQQANLIGPFFALLRIKADTLKNQAAAANWQCEFIYRQDDVNYAARLSRQ
jgi:hypothetical protein